MRKGKLSVCLKYHDSLAQIWICLREVLPDLYYIAQIDIIEIDIYFWFVPVDIFKGAHREHDYLKL